MLVSISFDIFLLQINVHKKQNLTCWELFFIACTIYSHIKAISWSPREHWLSAGSVPTVVVFISRQREN